MKDFILFITLTTLILTSYTLYAQPPQFEYPCDDFSFPDTNPSSELFTIVTFDGGNFEDGDFVVAIDSDGLIVGRNRIRVDEGCLGSGAANAQSLLNLTIYSDEGNGACATDWGANAGEELTLVVATNNSFYQIPGTYTFPSDGSPSFQPDASGGDFCYVESVSQADDVYAPFPVTLESFRGYTINSGKAVQLEWVSIQEENVSHFEVEYSKNGTEWESIGRIEAAGNSSVSISYDFIDDGELNTENFYRLNMLDLDGSSDHSGIVVVTVNDTGDRQVSFFPNPADAEHGNLSIQLKGQWDEAQAIRGELIDISGRSLVVYDNLHPGTTSVALPASAKPGLYLLRVTQADAVFTHKISLR